MQTTPTSKPARIHHRPAPRPTTAELRMPGPLDWAASLEMFRRSGDDLLDRWDGRAFLRTIEIDRHIVAIAIRFAGTRINLIAHVTVNNGDYAAAAIAAIRSTFLPPPRHFVELRRTDPIIARLESRYPGF